MDLLDAHPNLVVLRTFSKAYRLAALRVGYAVAAPEVATALRKVCSPFSVSSLAQAGAIAALDAQEELLASCAEVIDRADGVRDALLAAGFTVPPTQANFVWLPLGERTAAFAAHCLDKRSSCGPSTPDGVRVTVTTPGGERRASSRRPVVLGRDAATARSDSSGPGRWRSWISS